MTNLTGCGSKSSVTPTGNLDSGIALVQQKIASESPHVINSSNVTRQGRLASMLMPTMIRGSVALSAIWGTSGQAPTGSNLAIDNLYNGGGETNNGNGTCTINGVTFPCSESGIDYMGQALVPNFENSNGAATTVFGRMKMAFAIPCVIAKLTPAASLDTDNLPKAGTLTVTFPSSNTDPVFQSTANNGCGMDVGMAGQSVSITVAAVTGSSLYTKTMIPSIPGGNPNTMWLKYDATNGVLNFLSVEDQRPSERYSVDRTTLSATGLNGTNTAKISFEYISLGSPKTDSGTGATCSTSGSSSCGYELYRAFIDETNDVSYLLANYGAALDSSGGTNTPSMSTQYTVASKPIEVKACTSSSCTATLALSVGVTGEPNGSGGTFTAAGDYNGCIDPVGRAIATDNSLSCDVTGTTISSATAIAGERQVYVSDVVATLLANTGANTTLAFTGATDIYTAVPTN